VKIAFQKITNAMLNNYADDRHEISRLTLMRLYQNGVKKYGPDIAFAVVLGSYRQVRPELKLVLKHVVPLEVVLGSEVIPSAAVYGANLNQISTLCIRQEIPIWAVLAEGAHHLAIHARNKLSSREFPRELGVGDEVDFMFDPAVFEMGFSEIINKLVRFQYVPDGFFETLALRRYDHERKKRNTTVVHV